MPLWLLLAHVHVSNQRVNLRQISLMVSLDFMLARGDVLVEVIINFIANLTVVVVVHRSRNRYHVQVFPIDAFENTGSLDVLTNTINSLALVQLSSHEFGHLFLVSCLARISSDRRIKVIERNVETIKISS